MRLAVISDFSEENWPSMDILADELVERASGVPGLDVRCIRPRMPAPFKRLMNSRAPSGFVHNLDRVSGRYLEYSARILRERARFDRFHLVDHSYAHLALFLPGRRTGVFCHDIDAFRPLYERKAEGWRRALAATLLAGLKRANVVFHSNPIVRGEILEYGLVPEERLVHAPYGVAAEFRADAGPEDAPARERPPYLLHVGSLIPRKNPEFLLRVFGAIARARPELEFLQVGGEFSPALEALIDELGLASRLRRLPRHSQRELAPLYRNARVVLMPSLSEGFGLPVIEALSCGAPVVASDIPVFRQVGGTAVNYAPTSELEAWQARVLEVLAGDPSTTRAERLAQASIYSWQAHTEIIVRAHQQAHAGGHG
jgi:glycosyltransferase involved in cell wall biosynthesis